MQAPRSPQAPQAPRTGASPLVLALTNLGSALVGAVIPVGLYFADVIGEKAVTKADAQVEIVRLQAERDSLEIKTEAAAAEFRVRTEATAAQLEAQRVDCREARASQATAFSASYDTLLQVCLRRVQ